MEVFKDEEEVFKDKAISEDVVARFFEAEEVTIFLALHLLLQAQRKNGRCWDILEKVPWN